MSDGTLAPALPWSTRPLPHRRPSPPRGRCRVCGCTDVEGCVIEVHHALPGTASAVVDGRPVALTGAAHVSTCRWVEPGLCSRCHGPRHPTRRQEGELARIRDRFGRVTVRPAARDGWLTVYLDAQASVNVWGEATSAAPALELAPTGVALQVGGPRQRHVSAGGSSFGHLMAQRGDR